MVSYHKVILVVYTKLIYPLLLELLYYLLYLTDENECLESPSPCTGAQVCLNIRGSHLCLDPTANAGLLEADAPLLEQQSQYSKLTYNLYYNN